MEELNFEQMENIEGGASCFFAVPFTLLSIIGHDLWNPIYGLPFLSYCWNS